MHVLLEYAATDCVMGIYLIIKHAHQTMTVEACFVRLICVLETAKIKVYILVIQII